MRIVSIDVGTSSMKTVLYDEQGKLLELFSYEYYSEYPKTNWVEQKPNSWKVALIDVLSRMGNYCQRNNIKIDALAVTSQRSSVIPMDSEGNPLYSAIMWQDKRTTEICDRLIEEYSLNYFHKKTGLRVNPYFVLPKIIWLRENMPDIYNKTSKFIGVMDYVVYLLTGKYTTDYSQACRTLMMDIKNFTWDKDLMALGGIDEDKLPQLVAPGSNGGGLTKQYSDLTGVPEGVPVILSGGDQQNAAIALGVTKSGRAEANSGTGSFVIAAVDEPFFDEEARILCQASAIPGKWILEAGIFNTGATYRWYRNTFYPEVVGRDDDYHIMNRDAMKSPAGSNGLMMIPHFLGSAAPYWNPHAKSMFFNLSFEHTRADFTRSIQEGIAIEIATNLRLMQELTGELELVSVAGGMTRSNLFCEIQANTYGARVARFENSEASSLGAAMVAATSLGYYSDIGQAVNNMTASLPKFFEPDPELVEVYEDVYDRKQKLYNALNDGKVYEIFSQV